jgi:hypothetical protein
MITVRQPGTITAASPSYADVSAAVSSASPGDTVIVPVGTATWSSNLIITKGIKLIGAGIGQTVITGNFINNYNGDYFNTGRMNRFDYRVSRSTWTLKATGYIYVIGQLRIQSVRCE